MTGKLIKRSFYYSLALFVMSCVTINVYFPAAAVEKAADKIVDEVWGDDGGSPGTGTEKQGVPESRLDNTFRSTVSFIGVRDAFAQEADVNVTTPAIRALKESIQGRSDLLKPFLDSGNVGVASSGLLEMRSAKGLNLKKKADLTRLLSAENSDRKALYAEIAKANNFGPEKIPDIQKIFAGSWIKNARKDWWVQNEKGEWVRK